MPTEIQSLLVLQVSSFVFDDLEKCVHPTDPAKTAVLAVIDHFPSFRCSFQNLLACLCCEFLAFASTLKIDF